MDDLQWEPCSVSWVRRHNVCETVIRRKDGARPHEHLMNQGAPVLWRDAIQGQVDRLMAEDGERVAWAAEAEGPF